MDDWLTFDGTGRLDGSDAILSAGKGGSLTFKQADVQLGGSVLVRNRSTVSFIDFPEQRLSDPAQRPRKLPSALAQLCPSGTTCCIGGIHICCENYLVLGPCADTYDCSKLFRPMF